MQASFYRSRYQSRPLLVWTLPYNQVFLMTQQRDTLLIESLLLSTISCHVRPIRQFLRKLRSVPTAFGKIISSTPQVSVKLVTMRQGNCSSLVRQSH